MIWRVLVFTMMMTSVVQAAAPYATIQLRRDTPANWASVNPILKAGEPGCEVTGSPLRCTAQKIGDGVTHWLSLPYVWDGRAVAFKNTSTLQTIGRGGSGGIVVNDLVAKGPWIDARSETTLAAADAAAVAAGKLLVISSQWDTVPATLNAAIKVLPGGKFNNAEPLTINGPFDGADGCFIGAGTVVMANGYYNLAWFPGDSANEKWDALRAGFVTDKRIKIFAPRPQPGSAGATTPDGLGQVAWKVTAPLIFDDPENELEFYADAQFMAVNSMTSMFEFSPVNKTEDIRFPNGLQLDGANNATSGMRIHGGARIQFEGSVLIRRVTGKGIDATLDIAPIDELSFDFLQITDYGTVGCYIAGKTGADALGTHIKYFFTNGAKSGATNVLHVSGRVRDMSVEHFLENTHTPGGLYAVSDSLVKLESTSDGSPAGNINFGVIYGNIANVAVLKTVDSSGGTQSKISGSIGRVHTNATASPLVDLSYVRSFTIGGIWQGSGAATHLNIGATSSFVYVTGVDSAKIANSGTDNIFINGRQIGATVPLDITAAGALSTPLEITNTSATAGTEVFAKLAPSSSPSTRYAGISASNDGTNKIDLKLWTGSGSDINPRFRMDERGNVIFGYPFPVLDATVTHALAIPNGVAPTASPAGAFQMYGANVSGNSSPHFRTENGAIVKLYQQAANADTSGATLIQLEAEVNELKTLLRNLGLLAP